MRMIFQRRIHLSWCINLNFELTLLGIIQRHKRLLLVAWVHDLQLEYDSNKKECMLKVPLFAHLDLRWKAFKISNWETRQDLLELALASKIFTSFQMKLQCVRIFLQKDTRGLWEWSKTECILKAFRVNKFSGGIKAKLYILKSDAFFLFDVHIFDQFGLVYQS